MLKLKKVLAVGTVVAVAGMWTGVSAQTGAVVTGAALDATKTKSTEQPLIMSVEITSVVDMVVTPTPITEAQFKTHNPRASNDSTGGHVAGNIQGSLATVDVICTRSNWDVTLIFENGGYLVSGGTYVPPVTCDGWNPLDGPCNPSAGGTTGAKKLKSKVGAVVDTHQVVVAVGVGGVTGSDTGITPANLGTAKTAATAISLAKYIGTRLGAATTFDGTTTGTSIATSGFPGADATKTTRLWINAGLALGANDVLVGNEDGTYEEKVTVTLVASY